MRNFNWTEGEKQGGSEREARHRMNACDPYRTSRVGLSEGLCSAVHAVGLFSVSILLFRLSHCFIVVSSALSEPRPRPSVRPTHSHLSLSLSLSLSVTHSHTHYRTPW